jgi:hypothetical protein
MRGHRRIAEEPSHQVEIVPAEWPEGDLADRLARFR